MPQIAEFPTGLWQRWRRDREEAAWQLAETYTPHIIRAYVTPYLQSCVKKSIRLTCANSLGFALATAGGPDAT